MLEQLDEFHFASFLQINSSLLTDLMEQLGNGLRKLSLNLEFPDSCLLQWSKKKRSVVKKVTHLELNLRERHFSFVLVTQLFNSLTHLTLLVPENKRLYLEIFQNLPKLSRLLYLHLIETQRFPPEGIISMLNECIENSGPLRNRDQVKSVKVLHLDVSLKNYRKVGCLYSLFPNLQEIAFKHLNIDSDCLCESASSKPYRTFLTECDTCCKELKELLRRKANFHSLKVYGVEPESYYEEKYGKEDWSKGRYKWL